jgi:hypothetical protein
MIREILHELEQAIKERDRFMVDAWEKKQEDRATYHNYYRGGLIQAYEIVKQYEREED